MTASYNLLLDMKSYWHPGTGKGSGSHVDAVVEKDRFGCPFIAGRMLKGLLRDAVFRTLSWNSGGFGENGPATENVIEILFGSWAFEAQRPRHQTVPGLIRLSDAVLDEEVRQWLAEEDACRQALFRDIYSTAIDSAKGVAKQGSLRGKQVVVPVKLQAKLEIMAPFNISDQKDETWVCQHAEKIINTALPLIRAVGAGRTRGLGRVSLSLGKIV